MAKNIFSAGSGGLRSLEQGIIADRHKTVIGIKGIGQGAGATFMAMNLAFEMAQQAGTADGVTFAEEKKNMSGNCSAEYMLNVDPYYRRITAIGRTNLYKNVNWVFSAEDLRSLPGRFIVVDNPLSCDDLDLIAAVIDPLPSRIEGGLETFKELQNQQTPVIWIANKVNPRAGIRDTEKYLKLKFDYRTELLPAEIFYKAEYACTQQYFVQKPQILEKLVQTILEHNK